MSSNEKTKMYQQIVDFIGAKDTVSSKLKKIKRYIIFYWFLMIFGAILFVFGPFIFIFIEYKIWKLTLILCISILMCILGWLLQNKKSTYKRENNFNLFCKNIDWQKVYSFVINDCLENNEIVISKIDCKTFYQRWSSLNIEDNNKLFVTYRGANIEYFIDQTYWRELVIKTCRLNEYLILEKNNPSFKDEITLINNRNPNYATDYYEKTSFVEKFDILSGNQETFKKAFTDDLIKKIEDLGIARNFEFIKINERKVSIVLQWYKNRPYSGTGIMSLRSYLTLKSYSNFDLFMKAIAKGILDSCERLILILKYADLFLD